MTLARLRSVTSRYPIHLIGLTDVLEGTVDPALARGRARWPRQRAARVLELRPARKYYRPTPAGYEALTEGTASWSSLVDIVGAVLNRPVPTAPLGGA